MPNHVHLIVLLMGDGERALKQRTLGHVIGSYKAGVTRVVRGQALIDDGYPLWQERFHDHIIRSEQELNRIQEYVLHNPALWAEDQLRTYGNYKWFGVMNRGLTFLNCCKREQRIPRFADGGPAVVGF